MPPSLAEKIYGNTEALAVLISGQTNVQKAKALTAMGIASTESSVRRWQTAFLTSEDKILPPIKEAAVPKGWEPYAEESGKVGSAVVRLPRPDATERDLLVTSGYNPDTWRIKGAINTRRWMRHDQEWLFYYKFDVEQGESEESKWIHVEDLVKQIRRRTRKPTERWQGIQGAPATYTFVLSDWQIGKAEGGRGTADTVARYKDCLDQAEKNIKALWRLGVNITHLALVSVGDLVEGCGDHYDMQQFSVDADRRTQNRIVRELLTETILRLAPLFEHTTVAVIGGNHGENRKEGKAYTTFADNDDVGSPEAVKEAFDLAGWGDRISWFIPGEELSMVVDLSGIKVGLVHGHQFRGGANALKKAEDWWRTNDFGLQAVREAQILLSGHFHHLCVTNVTHGRTWMQAPTIDPGSKWYTDTSGVTAIPGVLTFVTTKDSPYGYDHLRVLHPEDSGV